MNTRGEIRLTEEMLNNMGFKKMKFKSSEGLTLYCWKLDIAADVEDFYLVTNSSQESNFPVVHFSNTDTYEFQFAEPLIVLLNILQSNCQIEEFKIN